MSDSPDLTIGHDKLSLFANLIDELEGLKTDMTSLLAENAELKQQRDEQASELAAFKRAVVVLPEGEPAVEYQDLCYFADCKYEWMGFNQDVPVVKILQRNGRPVVYQKDLIGEKE